MFKDKRSLCRRGFLVYGGALSAVLITKMSTFPPSRRCIKCTCVGAGVGGRGGFSVCVCKGGCHKAEKCACVLGGGGEPSQVDVHNVTVFLNPIGISKI